MQVIAFNGKCAVQNRDSHRKQTYPRVRATSVNVKMSTKSITFACDILRISIRHHISLWHGFYIHIPALTKPGTIGADTGRRVIGYRPTMFDQPAVCQCAFFIFVRNSSPETTCSGVSEIGPSILRFGAIQACAWGYKWTGVLACETCGCVAKPWEPRGATGAHHCSDR
jgi:hypothetical protein